MDGERRSEIAALTAAADRLDDLAEVAELMDDESGALALRDQAAANRAEAMSLLDEA